MPRSRPGAIRAHLPSRPERTCLASHRTVVPRISIATAAAVLRWESTHPHLSVGSVARALFAWSHLAWAPLRRLINDLEPTGCPCCAQGPDQRDILQAALTGLASRPARDLRRLVGPLDDLVLRRTVPAPYTPPGLPWWHGRC